MPSLSYHAGQIAVQEEAKTRHVADKLARWVGPVDEFALDADLFLFATADADGVLSFAVRLANPRVEGLLLGGRASPGRLPQL